ncbi:TVP38/TMEM64 family protein [Patulibacter defluvii]|uniref:TVP38/TMEM64 family protein n=1 Tax=Patulibacter defluvii TaxID=3095358 RepID=UPI002A765197|nr:VTT domain-containing protein [Patulibacter sp. DM4]
MPPQAPAPDADAPARRPLLRLTGLLTGLLTLGLVFAVGGILGTGTIRGWIDPLGAAAPVAYVLLAGILGAALVPGAALAAVAGLLFGAVAGALLALASAVLSSLLAHALSSRVGGEALEDVSGERLRRLTAFARRNGLLAVIVQRLLPAIPDGPLSHAFGLARVRPRDLALGTLIAGGPRALSYALLGSSADDLTGPDAIAGVVLNVTTGVAGLALAWWVIVRERRRAAGPATGER